MSEPSRPSAPCRPSRLATASRGASVFRAPARIRSGRTDIILSRATRVLTNMSPASARPRRTARSCAISEALAALSTTNFANITTRFKNPPYDPDNTYTVPYQWGTIGLGYNHDTVGKDLTSWNDMLTSDKKVAWLDEPRPMLGLALKMLGDDPNTSDTTQIEAAGQYLIDHSKNVTAIAPDNGQDLLAAGQADIVVEYSGDIFQVINDCACNKFRYDIPSEGSVIWVDNLAMPRNAKNKALAQVFMDYILTAQPGADISNFTSYATPNQAAIDEGLIDSTSLHNPAIYPDEALQSKLFFVQSSTDLEQKYATVWDKVKKAVGK